MPEKSSDYADWLRAWAWLCDRRKKAPADADVWHLRWRWLRDGTAMFNTVRAGRWRLSPMQIAGRGPDAQAMWSAEDALVLKWVALRTRHMLPQHSGCHHLAGGTRHSLRAVREALEHRRFHFVHRTDIRGYYRNIRKDAVIALIKNHVTDTACRDLIEQYVFYSVESGGEITTPHAGIPRGCALSPLIGGSLLRHIDGDFRSLDPDEIFYVRYMDDFLIFTRSRWQLRRSIARLAGYFDVSGFSRHPDKTQTGQLSRGFDWLGIWFSEDGTAISARSLKNHHERRERLYEQARKRGASVTEAAERVHAYEARWQRWAGGQLCAASARQ